MDFGMIAVKLVTGFLGLWIMTRLLGKKEISQLTPFDFVSSLMLSELVGNTVYQKDAKYIYLLYALFIWFILSYIFEKITQFARRARGPLEGKPSLLIRHGEVDLKEMKNNRVDFEQLLMMLRQKDIFSIREVAYAIFEPNGSLSVMKYDKYEALQKGDLPISKDQAGMSFGVLEEGRISEERLHMLGKDIAWLICELKKQGYGNPGDLAYVEWQQGRGLYVVKYAQNRQAAGKNPQPDSRSGNADVQ